MPEEYPMNVEPQKEHRWLQRLVGEWTATAECTTEPGKPPETHAITEHVRSLGGIWVLAEGRGEMPGGGEATTQMMLGYDPRTRRFVGTFIASMMTHLWVYDGALDAAEKVLTLETEGPDMANDPQRLVKYRDVMTLESHDHRILTSFAVGPDGTWQPFMTAHYTRT
jgi:hypothetical protein